MSLLIPWCAVEMYRPGRAPILIHDPENRDIGRWLEWVCHRAWRARAAIIFSCSTAKEAEVIADAATSMLPPDFERVAIERVVEGKAHRASLN